MMVKVLPKSKQTCVCTFVPSAGKCLPLKIQKTSLLYQLIPSLQFLVNYYWQWIWINFITNYEVKRQSQYFEERVRILAVKLRANFF